MIAFWTSMGWMEQGAVALGLLYVILSVRQSPWCWPLGIGSVLLWAVVVFEGRLYMDALLQLVYAALGVYGWWCWAQGRPGQGDRLPVSRLSRPLAVRLLAVTAVGTLVLGAISAYVFRADFPWLDSFTTALSLAAQYLLARKVLENWLLWVVADTVYVGLYLAKGWPGFAGLMVVYTGMACLGWYLWWRDAEVRVEQRATTAPAQAPG